MKKFQIVLFLLSFLFVGSLVQAQATATVIFTCKNMFGEENIKLIMSEADEQWVYYQGTDDSDFKKMTIQSFTRSGEEFTVKFSDAAGNKYVAKNAAKTGLLVSFNGGSERAFGMSIPFRSGVNKFEIIHAGENTHFYFECPSLKFDDKLVPIDGEKFFNELMTNSGPGRVATYTVKVEPGLSTKKEKHTVYIYQEKDGMRIDVVMKGKTISFKS
jgi:hypothetical protein